MSESHENKKKSYNRCSQLLQERIEKANPSRTLTTEEIKRLNKLEAIGDKLKREENVQSGGKVIHSLQMFYKVNVSD